ncbi:MAG: carbohydrate ABC transporter permease [Lachnospiraceae bacterium]|nr:carbohydrate ABC transporter permease [Lachnospiraceae bacterium]
MIRKTKHRTKEDCIIDFIVYFLAVFIFIVTFYPFYLSIVMAFNEGKDALRGGIYLWPRVFTTENFKELVRDTAWGRALIVTILRTILGTGVTVFFTTLMAYGLSFQNLRGRKTYMIMIIIAMYFSGGVIPYYMVLRTLHLVNSFWVYIVPGAINLFYVLVAISFFEGIPKEMGESARIDGASEITIYLRLIFPVSKPLLATIAIFTAVGHWNSWYDSAFFIQNKDLRTLGYQLMSIINKANVSNTPLDAYSGSQAQQSLTPMSIQLAAMLVAVGPILLVYPFFQRYFVSGLTIGAVKG